MRWIRRVLVALLTVVIVGAGFGIWLVRRSFPVMEGSVVVSGLDDSVTISRDDAGIPHIRASTSHDLFFAQGYVHAQDRFWQMDTWRHIGAGRLSEMFGDGQVETDMFLRTLGFERLAAEAYAEAPPDAREALDAYADGVNAYLEERPGGAPLSLEYSVLGLQNSGYRPEPWEPIHSLTWAHVMAWDLRSNLEAEIERALLLGAVGPDRTEQLFPPYPDDHPLIVRSGATGTAAAPVIEPEPGILAAVERTAGNVGLVEGVLGRPFEGIGSNNWVVDGSRTATGAPLLSNDPHLGIQLPSIWYQATLWCEDPSDSCPYRVAGFSFPGAPGIVVGHNGRIAWGVTNLGPDTMDLFIERTRGDQYEVDGEWVDFETRTEKIRVAGGEDVDLEIRSTSHGPIVSGRFGPVDDLEQSGLDLPEEYEVALAWQALQPATLFRAILGFNRASNWEEFREAARYFDIAAQNLVYADVDGHIGYQATGEIPVRRSGDGRYPVPGWTTDHDWIDLIPFEDLPAVLDPPSGIIVTANQPVVDADHPTFIGVDHAYGYRANRITELLEAAGPLDPEMSAAIQMDNYDASAAAVVPSVLDLESDLPELEEMQEVLGRWSELSRPYQMDADSPGAAAWAAVWRHLLALTFDELPEPLAAEGNSRYFEVVGRLLETPDDPWWDHLGTGEVEGAADILRRAVIDAHGELVDRLGDDPAGWRWGDLHRATFAHQTLGQSGIGAIEALFNRTAPPGVSGGAAIVNATSWLASNGYEVVAVPSMRLVVDLADPSRSLALHAPGQSGHAFHPNYRDLIEGWMRGGMRPLIFDPADMESDLVLELSPA
jgi:penicillin G amidase